MAGMEKPTTETHPVQTHHIRQREQSRVPKAVSMRAYEVYCSVWSPQEALVTGNCRGGFGVNELLALLYARSFPESEWRQRFHEASDGLVNL